MPADLIRLLRPTDWTKNVFVFPALVFSLPRLLADSADRTMTLMALTVPTIGAFVAFCLLASGFYAINDVLDVERDRQHPIKRRRPVASGAVPVQTAVILGAVLIAAGVGLGFVVNSGVGQVLLAYAALQTLYNVRLKRVMFVDVTVLALGFALRAAAGAVAIDRPISIWLILCVFFLCLYLAFVKRLCDLVSAERANAGAWSSPAGYNERDELNWMLGVSATLAVVTYLMYSLSDQTWSDFGVKSIGFALLTPLVLIAIQRFYRRAMAGESDSPFATLIRDRAVMAAVVMFAVGVVVILYLPYIGHLLETIFYFPHDGRAGSG